MRTIAHRHAITRPSSAMRVTSAKIFIEEQNLGSENCATKQLHVNDLDQSRAGQDEDDIKNWTMKERQFELPLDRMFDLEYLTLYCVNSVLIDKSFLYD